MEIKELSAPVGEFYRHVSESCTMFFSRGFEEQEWVSVNLKFYSPPLEAEAWVRCGEASN